MTSTARDRSVRDDGFALIIVLATMTILMGLLTVVLISSTRTIKTVSSSSAWNQALMAADAGVSDYLARLNADETYWQKVDCANDALKGPTTATNTCGWGSSTTAGWANVPGGQGAQFHYEVNKTTTPSSGTVVLTVSGKMRDESRTIQVRMRRGGFGEFLYYTVYETVDPENEAVYGYKNADAIAKCPKYYYESRPSSCSDINFVTGDVFDGPVHTNDAMLMNGSPKFNGTVTTSYPTCNKATPTTCYRKNGSPTPVFAKGIAFRDPIQLPETIGDLKPYVDPTKPTSGCLYTGPTRIKIANGSGTTPSTMKVWSPWTKTVKAGCGTVPLNGAANIPIPHDNLIYVQNVPSGFGDPYGGASKNPGTGACPAGWIGDSLPLDGTTTTGDYSQTLDESKCTYGTAYLEGTLKGRLTIAAEANIIVTGNTTYSGGRTGTDALGLMANESVKIYHPVRCTNYSAADKECNGGTNLNRPVGSTFADVQLNAAILTLRHSFTVQQYQFGDRLGDLNLFGTIAQKFRGPVGTTGNSGYLKKYVYDTRMRYAPPPYFLDPVRSAWGVKTYGELTPRY